MGKLAYAAYCNAVGGTTFDGKPLPTWEELGQRQRDGWEAAAQAIRDQCAMDFTTDAKDMI